MSKQIHIPTEAENEAALDEFFQQKVIMAKERSEACTQALPALDRLALVMCNRSGQCYKVRSILYSLWNGKPTDLSQVMNLDWELRKDLVAVILAFGWEDKTIKFFYDAIQSTVTKAGQWDWFLQERFEINALREYVKQAEQQQ